ncbi:MAG: DUF3656 domain-containing protein, partial [Christensenellales bacterium]
KQKEINIKAKVNYPIQVEFKSGEYIYKSTGGIVEVAKNKAVSEDIFKEQIVKIGDLNKVFKITSISCEIDNNIFVSLSEINSLRRDALNVIVETIINSSKLPFVKKELFRSQYNKATLNKIAIVDESCNQNQLYKLSKIYEALILSPTFYKVDIIKSFYEDYKKYFKNSLILNMPIIALKNDLKILDELVGYCKNNGISILANNIYALDYIKDGVDVIAGSNMNICNEYACETLSKLGIKEMVSSIEKWCGGIKGTYRMCKGKRVLMTFAHCPFKTLTKLDCDKTSSCGYSGKLDLVGDNQQYRIRRYKISSCYFELVDSFVENRDSEHQIDDLREGDYV